MRASNLATKGNRNLIHVDNIPNDLSRETKVQLTSFSSSSSSSTSSF